MNTLTPYTAPSDIDRHVRDRDARNALVQHGRGCACGHCSERAVWLLLLDAAHDLRQAGEQALTFDVAAGYGPAWIGRRP